MSDAEKQKHMFDAAQRRTAERDKLMMEFLFGKNPITDDDLRKLIAKRPNVYGRYAGYLGKRGKQ